jgi:hypothetical protein
MIYSTNDIAYKRARRNAISDFEDFFFCEKKIFKKNKKNSKIRDSVPANVRRQKRFLIVLSKKDC